MIVVTGGSGYVGSHIVKMLTGIGLPTRVMVRNKQKAKQENRLNGLEAEIVEGDVTRAESLKAAFENASAVIHTVAIAVERAGNTYEHVNTQGTINVVEAARSMGVRRLVNLSQLGADANLPYRFLASKGRAQDYVANSGLDWTAFRPSVIWGPEDEFANTFARLIPLTPIIFPIVDRQAKFQPVWVEDVATCIVECLEDNESVHKDYELGGPEVLTLEEIERRTLEAVGAHRKLVPFPKPVLKAAVGLMETLLPAPPVTRSLLELLEVDNVTSQNEISRFVDAPKPFTSENAAGYMREFKVSQTLSHYLGRG